MRDAQPAHQRACRGCCRQPQAGGCGGRCRRSRMVMSPVLDFIRQLNVCFFIVDFTGRSHLPWLSQPLLSRTAQQPGEDAPAAAAARKCPAPPPCPKAPRQAQALAIPELRVRWSREPSPWAVSAAHPAQLYCRCGPPACAPSAAGTVLAAPCCAPSPPPQRRTACPGTRC